MTDLNSNDSKEVYSSALRSVYFVLSICGLIFCSMILIILGKKLKKTKHSDTILTIITVSMDCLSSGGLLFRAIFTQYPYNILQVHFNWCAYDAFLNSSMLVFSGCSLGVLSVQRMFLVVFNIRMNIYFWLIIIMAFIITIWGQVIYLIASNSIQLSITGVFCIARASAKENPFYLTLITFTLLAYVITIISYLSIIIFSCKQCLNQLNLNIEKQIVYRECRGIVFRSLLFLIPYMLIYSGRIYTWLYEYSTGKPRTWTMEYVSTIQVSTSVVVNCLTVLYMHKDVNNELFKLLTKLKSTVYCQ